MAAIALLVPSWWTETNGVWVQAIFLFVAFVLQLVLLWLTLREQREARGQRRIDEVARQRSETTCGGVTSILRKFNDDELCVNLWAGNFRRAGFAFEKTLYSQLPEFLRIKCEPFIEEIQRPFTHEQNKVARFLLVFRFPYPRYDAVLEDVNRLNFGNVPVAWDEFGKSIKINRS